MVAEIQRKTIKQGKRNSFSRLVHASSDKEMIATWRSDLNRILFVFNVRSVVLVWPSLTIDPQTELAINTYAIASDIHHDVVNIHAVVSDTHHDILNTRTLVFDIHRNMLESREGADSQYRLVGATHTLQRHRINAYHLTDSE